MTSQPGPPPPEPPFRRPIDPFTPDERVDQGHDHDQGQGQGHDQGQGQAVQSVQVRSTRVSAWWVGMIIAALLLIVLLIFIAQNSDTVAVHFLGMHGQVPLAVALLLSAVAAVLLVAIPGTARIVQLRRALKRCLEARPDNYHGKS